MFPKLGRPSKVNDNSTISAYTAVYLTPVADSSSIDTLIALGLASRKCNNGKGFLFSKSPALNVTTLSNRLKDMN